MHPITSHQVATLRMEEFRRHADAERTSGRVRRTFRGRVRRLWAPTRTGHRPTAVSPRTAS